MSDYTKAVAWFAENMNQIYNYIARFDGKEDMEYINRSEAVRLVERMCSERDGIVSFCSVREIMFVACLNIGFSMEVMHYANNSMLRKGNCCITVVDRSTKNCYTGASVQTGIELCEYVFEGKHGYKYEYIVHASKDVKLYGNDNSVVKDYLASFGAINIKSAKIWIERGVYKSRFTCMNDGKPFEFLVSRRKFDGFYNI